MIARVVGDVGLASASGAPTPPKNVQFYGWPQLYPTSADELISGTKKAVATRGAGLTHVATHTPRPLPMWL